MKSGRPRGERGPPVLNHRRRPSRSRSFSAGRSSVVYASAATISEASAQTWRYPRRTKPLTEIATSTRRIAIVPARRAGARHASHRSRGKISPPMQHQTRRAIANPRSSTKSDQISPKIVLPYFKVTLPSLKATAAAVQSRWPTSP